MQFNLLITALAALIPLLIGAIWYNPKVFGTAWRTANGFEEGYKSKTKLGVILLISYVLNFFMASTITMIVIHQFGFFSTLNGTPGLEVVGSDVHNFAKQFWNFMAVITERLNMEPYMELFLAFLPCYQ